PYLSVALSHDDVHSAVVIVVLDGVVDEVLDREPQQSLVGGSGAGSTELSSDCEMPILDVLLAFREALLDERPQRSPAFDRAGELGPRSPRELQQRRDEVLTAPVCFQCAPHRWLKMLRDLTPCQRELVGRGGDEALLLSEGGLEPVEHGVDRVAELLDLVGRTREVEPLVQVVAGDLLRGGGDLPDPGE